MNGLQRGLASPVLVNPPLAGGQGNTSFITTIDPNDRPGPYYIMSDVDGPTMMGRIDVLPHDQPVQPAGELAAAAVRQYEADLAWLAGQDRTNYPTEVSNPDGTKIWSVAAGSGNAQNKPWLSINEFAPSNMVIIAGDTVTWTNDSPGAVPHTVSGFGSAPDAVPQDLSPY